MLKSKIEPLELKAKRLNKELYSKIEMFILKYFKSSNNKKDKYHTVDIITILKNNGLIIPDNKITTIFNILGIGIYNKNITINKKVARGFTNIIYSGNDKE